MWLEHNAGKGTAVAAGIEALLASGARPDAVVVVDADGQHPPERIPQLAAAAADADLVIGDRLGQTAAMPRSRRFTNRVSSALLSVVTGRRVRDSQCGMRLYRTELLERVPPPPGRYEAETLHLRGMLRAGARVAWVPIPAIYDGAESSFRPVRDTLRVLAAISFRPGSCGGPWPGGRRTDGRARVAWPGREFWRTWGQRLAAIVVGTWALGAFIPLIDAADQKLFVAINSLGAGPDWVYQALDPHSRNYVLLCLAAVLVAQLTSPRSCSAFWRRRARRVPLGCPGPGGLPRARPPAPRGGAGRPGPAHQRAALVAHRLLPQRAPDGDHRDRRGGHVHVPALRHADVDLRGRHRGHPDHVRSPLPAGCGRRGRVRLRGRAFLRRLRPRHRAAARLGWQTPRRWRARRAPRPRPAAGPVD